ncbi:nucleoside triphosphate pyrophosphohydrolase [Haloprofundus halobius]|uniref:nucleoside triphosphate pyrophosphohydrolase n=1 Tax=Haloprofundus halobius TaxID=2876194 RepID=UPI001CCF59FB|nr:nucleoside triphosphate pyrophosphohydrolase [Haloprofundus halobius]
MSREYDKLVRDDIPGIIRDSGKRPVTHVADDEEYRKRLAEKLVEEAEEFRESEARSVSEESSGERSDPRDSGGPEELADVLEVVDAIREELDVAADELERMRREKREARGGFAKGVVLERVEACGTSETREQNP